MDNFKHTQMVTYLHLKYLRELLEYAIEGRNKTQKDYEGKKRVFEMGIGETGIINQIVIKNNPDKADKIKESYEDFLYDVFNGRVISFIDDKMVFDPATKPNFFNSIFQTRELFYSIANSQIQFARSNDKVNEDIEKLIASEDLLYRLVFLSLLHKAIKENFLEFVKEMSNSKGETSPQANFLSNIVSQYFKTANFILSSNPNLNSKEFNNIKHSFLELIYSIGGKNGKKTMKEQEECFILAIQDIDVLLATASVEVEQLFQPLIKEMVEFEKANKAKQ